MLLKLWIEQLNVKHAVVVLQDAKSNHVFIKEAYVWYGMVSDCSLNLTAHMFDLVMLA